MLLITKAQICYNICCNLLATNHKLFRNITELFIRNWSGNKLRKLFMEIYIRIPLCKIYDNNLVTLLESFIGEEGGSLNMKHKR